MLFLSVLVAGMFCGWLAQLILGSVSRNIDWGMALIAGLSGSFVGGLPVSLIAGDGLALRPGGIIGSIVGAIVARRRTEFNSHPVAAGTRRSPAGCG